MTDKALIAKAHFYCLDILIMQSGQSAQSLGGKKLSDDNKLPSISWIKSACKGENVKESNIIKLFDYLNSNYFNSKLQQKDFIFSSKEFRNPKNLKLDKSRILDLISKSKINV